MSKQVKFDIFANDKTARVFNKVQGHIGKISASIKKIGLIGAAVAAGGLAALAVGLKKVTDYASVQEAAESELAAVLKATGEAAGYTLDDLKAMASGFQAVTKYGDETTLSGMAILATFKKIRGEAFERATMAAMDMSTIMKQDLKSSMVQIGKALNDPITGLTALSRVGVTFTEQQKEQITALQESGDLMGAQKIILEELESQFGGAAKAATETFGGALTQLSNAWGDLLESLGYVITKNEYFYNLLIQIRQWVEALIVSVDDWASKNKELVAQKFDEYLWTVIDVATEFYHTFWDVWDVVESVKYQFDDLVDTFKEVYDWYKKIKSVLSKTENLLNSITPSGLNQWISDVTGYTEAHANDAVTGSYATGTGPAGLPRDGLYYGHKGEIVNTKAESDSMRKNAGGTVNVSLNVQYMTGDANAARNAAREIQRLLKSQGLRWGTA